MGFLDRVKGLIAPDPEEPKRRAAANPERELAKIMALLRRQLADGRSRMSMAVRDEKKLLREVSKMKAEIHAFLERAKLEVAQGNDREARRLLARKNETQVLIQEHMAEVERQREVVVLLKDSLKELAGKLKGLESRRKLLRTKVRRTKALEARRQALRPDGIDTDALLAEASARLEIEEELLLEAGGEVDELERKFRELEADPEAQIESLEDLKLLIEEAEDQVSKESD